MIVVVFEGIPHVGKMQTYLDMAPKYKEHLQKMEGFISNERFQSSADPNKVLSVSYWKDEEAIKNFRKLEMHLEDEQLGRTTLFKDFRIRIASVFRDYSASDRHDAPTN